MLEIIAAFIAAYKLPINSVSRTVDCGPEVNGAFSLSVLNIDKGWV